MRIVRSQKTSAAAFRAAALRATRCAAQAAWRYSSSASMLMTEVANSVSA